MAQFAKYVDEDTIIRPRKNYKSNTLVAFNFDKNETLLRQEGYLPLVEDEKPEAQEGYYLKPTYELAEDKILVHWTVEEIVEEEE